MLIYCSAFCLRIIATEMGAKIRLSEFSFFHFIKIVFQLTANVKIFLDLKVTFAILQENYELIYFCGYTLKIKCLHSDQKYLHRREIMTGIMQLLCNKQICMFFASLWIGSVFAWRVQNDARDIYIHRKSRQKQVPFQSL